jgi:2-polyprenyl-3-methyl-5-hydroxy-6-metoxy-1,4-benzoquinol methylase
MTTETSNESKSFYSSSDLYFYICEHRSSSSYKNLLDVIEQYVPKGASLLEFGCGTGKVASLVAALGYKTLGVDISDRFISYAKETYKAQEESLSYQLVGFGPLPFSDQSFDCIYTSAVLEHCYEVEKIVADLHRLLKPGGLLVIGTPNLISPFTRVAFIAKRLLGKRKRFHLYGSPSFLLKALWLNMKKGWLKDTKPVYVTPRYAEFSEADEDVTFLSNHYDLLSLLKPLHYKIHELARGRSKGGKLIARFFPKLSGEVLIVAAKRALVILAAILIDIMEPFQLVAGTA